MSRTAKSSACSRRISTSVRNQRARENRALFASTRAWTAPQLRTNFLKFFGFFDRSRTASFRTFAVGCYPLQRQVAGAATVIFIELQVLTMATNTGSNTAVALTESRSLLDELVSPVAGASSKLFFLMIRRPPRSTLFPYTTLVLLADAHRLV